MKIFSTCTCTLILLSGELYFVTFLAAAALDPWKSLTWAWCPKRPYKYNILKCMLPYITQKTKCKDGGLEVLRPKNQVEKFRINDFTRQIVCVILFDITFQDKSLSVRYWLTLKSSLHWNIENCTVKTLLSNFNQKSSQ